MAEAILVDTGVLVALANRRDPDHLKCVAVMQGLRAQLFTVEGVLVEAAFLLSKQANGPARMLELAAAMKLERHTVSATSLTRVGQLLRQYRRMDLVDGLLVATADELQVKRILTLDRRDFSIYRLQSGEGFELLP